MPRDPGPDSGVLQDCVAVPEYGEVFTRRWIVDLILDLCGYSPDEDLTVLTIVEPAVGSGAFLVPLVERLIAAREKHSPDAPWESLRAAVVAMDLQLDHVRTCRELIVTSLIEAGCPRESARTLASGWIRQGDFLLADTHRVGADVVVGNPPYIRIEDLSPELLGAYRRACPTMGGRADVYIGFYEHGLDLLKPDGRLAFICADRWMRNQYGRRLREKIINGGFAVDSCLVMHDVQAFENDVAAYPAITVIRRGAQGEVAVGDTTELFNAAAAVEFAAWTAEPEATPIHTPTVTAARLPHWHTTNDSWPDGSPETLAWLEDLADRYPTLEDPATGTRIGIGVATGADSVYVTQDAKAAESERMLPLAMAADIKTGTYEWTGHYLVNPWDDDGLVDIDRWPQMARYLNEHAQAITRRSIAQRLPDRWYRTIDRVNTSLTDRPKLLLEDMKLQSNPVLEPGGQYPHHNLYYVISDGWDLEVLGGLLLSEVVERQIIAYCVKMRGKTLRFQAQYLRRIRVPCPYDMRADVSADLREAFRSRDRNAATAAALNAFHLRSLPK